MTEPPHPVAPSTTLLDDSQGPVTPKDPAPHPHVHVSTPLHLSRPSPVTDDTPSRDPVSSGRSRVT